jgi:hypothetical protein
VLGALLGRVGMLTRLIPTPTLKWKIREFRTEGGLQ